MQEDALAELQKRIGVSVSISNSNTKKIVDELEDTELLELASKLVGEGALSNKEVCNFFAQCILCNMYTHTHGHAHAPEQMFKLLNLE